MSVQTFSSFGTKEPAFNPLLFVFCLNISRDVESNPVTNLLLIILFDWNIHFIFLWPPEP